MPLIKAHHHHQVIKQNPPSSLQNPSSNPSSNSSSNPIVVVNDVPVSQKVNEILPPEVPPTASPVTEDSPIKKETLNNDHVRDLVEKDPQPKIETKTVSGLTLEPNEVAKFSIVLENTVDEVIHFGFSLISDTPFLHSSQLEPIVDNVVNVIISNLTNKVVSFAINYLSLHKL